MMNTCTTDTGIGGVASLALIILALMLVIVFAPEVGWLIGRMQRVAPLSRRWTLVGYMGETLSLGGGETLSFLNASLDQIAARIEQVLDGHVDVVGGCVTRLYGNAVAVRFVVHTHALSNQDLIDRQPMICDGVGNKVEVFAAERQREVVLWDRLALTPMERITFARVATMRG